MSGVFRMRSYLRRKLASLCGCRSGNATVIVALGMPMLVGGAGLGVDLAQWYMWKRELQFAVDQAAIAGAWARAENSTRNTYKARATQEFNANLGAVEDFATLEQADIALADYNGGVGNSVTVEATATKELPFSSFVTGGSATIEAFAQAVVEGGQIFTTCMLAVDPDDEDSFVIGGSADGSAECGFGALSDAESAIRKNGNPDVQAGYLVSAGGIDRALASNGTIHANVSGLEDPYEDLSPPDSPLAQTYICPPLEPPSTKTTANVTTRTQYQYDYKAGKKLDTATTYTGYASEKPDSTTSETFNGKTVENGTTAGTVTGSPFVTATVVENLGKGNSLWEIRTTTVTSTYSNVIVTYNPGSDGIARPQPGTYSNISIACETRFAPGVYIIQNNLDFGQNKTVIGTDVMFVLEQADKIHINSDSNINLSGITKATLLDYGVPDEEATLLTGMLIWDRFSDDQMKINGNATLKFEGVMYMPLREVWMNGNSTASGKCMILAAGRITLTGNNNLSNFCVPAGMTGIRIGGAERTVKLVA